MCLVQLIGVLQVHLKDVSLRAVGWVVCKCTFKFLKGHHALKAARWNWHGHASAVEVVSVQVKEVGGWLCWVVALDMWILDPREPL